MGHSIASTLKLFCCLFLGYTFKFCFGGSKKGRGQQQVERWVEFGRMIWNQKELIKKKKVQHWTSGTHSGPPGLQKAQNSSTSPALASQAHSLSPRLRPVSLHGCGCEWWCPMVLTSLWCWGISCSWDIPSPMTSSGLSSGILTLPTYCQVSASLDNPLFILLGNSCYQVWLQVWGTYNLALSRPQLLLLSLGTYS